MSNIIDGISLDTPPTDDQIIALADQHRKLLDEAIFHQDIHLGDYCLAQRKQVRDFISKFTPEQKHHFYQVYDGELRHIADDDVLHPADAEGGVGMFAIFITLVIIAFILYFAFVRSLMA